MSAVPSLPVGQTYHPTTFVERGVMVPFTTPMLAGTRARPAPRDGIELIVPSPAGGNGLYILSWTSVQELCSTTVHDRVLNEKVAALEHITPTNIRQAAREVAREGLAGREAQLAAITAAEADHDERLLTNFLLLLAVMQQVEPPDAQRRTLPARAARKLRPAPFAQPPTSHPHSASRPNRSLTYSRNSPACSPVSASASNRKEPAPPEP